MNKLFRRLIFGGVSVDPVPGGGGPPVFPPGTYYVIDDLTGAQIVDDVTGADVIVVIT
jgi:hypothetical protein